MTTKISLSKPLRCLLWTSKPLIGRNGGVSASFLVLTLALLLVVSLLSSSLLFVSASPALMATNNPPTYNNLDNLIADIFDEADDRLKKSKLNGARQVKQTLRFGRRSDPWMAANVSPDQMTVEELQKSLIGAGLI